jgi:hypothetical protein
MFQCENKFISFVDASEYRFIVEGFICTLILRTGGCVQGFAAFSNAQNIYFCVCVNVNSG